jgi:hypothetical protein
MEKCVSDDKIVSKRQKTTNIRQVMTSSVIREPTINTRIQEIKIAIDVLPVPC